MNNKFSENLKKIRKDNNLSQEQLADELGVSRQAISKWESAVAYPEMDKIITLCEKFNLNIDDLLHKDIREIKSEEESKKNINKYIDDFLNFITNTINMFSNMNFKSKIKCLFEQCVIGVILFVIFCIVGIIARDLLSGVFSIIPDRIYFVVYSGISFVYVVFSLSVSLMIMLHIFKTRYLDYYEKIKNEVLKENNDEETELNNENESVIETKKDINKIDKKNKFLFKKNENKIIIRDPKHSEYKFITGISKIIVSIIKFFTLCFSLILFAILIGLVFCFIISFLTYKTGLFFIGLLILFVALSVIVIDCILIILNFVFNRKNDKKKLIWSIIISLISIGFGIGLITIGLLNFNYIENDESLLKTDYIEFDMSNDLFFETYYETNDIQYIKSNIDNIKIEYKINKFCNVEYYNVTSSGIRFISECNNPIKIIKEVIKKFNDKKIISINNDIETIKIYASERNIEILKNNRNKHFKQIETNENLINSYEKRIGELEQKIDEYVENEWEYKQEIYNLKEQINNYQYE